MNQKEQDTTRMARSMESLRISSGLFQLRAYKVVPKLVKVTPISLLGLWSIYRTSYYAASTVEATTGSATTPKRPQLVSHEAMKPSSSKQLGFMDGHPHQICQKWSEHGIYGFCGLCG